MINRLAALLLSAGALLVSCGQNTLERAVSAMANHDSLTVERVKEAYICSLPLVLMDITRQQMTGPNPSSQDMIRPNVDTYYVSSWLDLNKGAIILSVPDTHDRYSVISMLDAYTNIFASSGTRTTGNGKRRYLITPPGWKGKVPAGMKRIAAPTHSVWIIGRIQVNSSDGDIKTMVSRQQQYKLTLLSNGEEYTYTHSSVLTNDSILLKGLPKAIVERMPVEEYFNYVNKLIAAYPPPEAEQKMLQRFTRIGVGSGLLFTLRSFPMAVRSAISALPKEIPAELRKILFSPLTMENGWNIRRLSWGIRNIDYPKRAAAALIGLENHLPEDAIYPICHIDSERKRLNGGNRYVLHFEKGQTPPTNAFWSITMYNRNGKLVDNTLYRYAIGNRNGLLANADGSVDIYIQHTPPGEEKERNWLPAPKDDFNLCLRVYYPKQSAINGSWKMVPVRRVL